MQGNSIEFLGQKVSYPTTWHGTVAVLIVCVCVAFLGYSLDKERIDSWSGVVNNNAEKAYNDALLTINKKDQQIQVLTNKITELTLQANLDKNQKIALNQDLESSRVEAEIATKALAASQKQKVDEWNRIKENMPLPQQQQQQNQFVNQQQQIQQQLQSLKQQQQQQLQWTQ